MMSLMARTAMEILILDDDQVRHDWFRSAFAAENHRSVLSYGDAIVALKAQRYDVIFLDHDLNEEEFTGADVACYIANEMPEEMRPKMVWIHSMNPVGASNIESIIRKAGIKTRRVPFGSL
jgi:CheY-like chemotaxis protein